MINTYPFAGVALQSDNTCNFSVWAPFRNKVALSVLKPGQTTYPMTKDEHGYWHVSIPDALPGMQYKYLLDDDILLPDPASRYQPEGVHGPSAVVDTHYKWKDRTWKGLHLAEMVIYELHTGTFTPQRNFQGIISRLEHLRSLGINAIEILPLAQFPGTRNWGYDGVYPFAVHNSYGSVDGLKELVDAAHLHGIAVILDVVYNHFGPEGNYFSQYGPWFTEKYKTPWGPAINFDDAWCDAVRAYFIQNALMWLDEFHIDGLRLDAVHAIWDCGARHFIEELSIAVRQLESSSGRKKVLIGEIDYNSPRYITGTERCGYGLDAQWIDEFHHALHSLLTREMNGYYADFGGIAPLAKSFRDSYVFTGQYSRVRKRNFGISPRLHDYHQFIVFAQNHDQIGNRMLGDRLSTQLSFEALKLVAAVTLLSPHVPLLFMGEEYGEQNPFRYFTDHSDETLIEVVRKGRKEEFAGFAWEGEVPDPQADDTFSRSMLSWDTHTTTAVALLEVYRFLIAFRKTRTALKTSTRESVWVNMPEQDEELLIVQRSGADDRLLLLFNFSDQPVEYKHTDSTTLSKKFDSAAATWNGPGATAPSEAASGNTISLQPHSATVYEIV